MTDSARTLIGFTFGLSVFDHDGTNPHRSSTWPRVSPSGFSPMTAIV
jgi:hypothetical protein